MTRRAEAAANAAMDAVTRVAGVRGCLVVSAGDGLVVAERLMEGLDGDAVAALTGSLVGRLARASESAGLGLPRFVQLRGTAGCVLATPLDEGLILVAVASPGANVGLARIEMLAGAGCLG